MGVSSPAPDGTRFAWRVRGVRGDVAADLLGIVCGVMGSPRRGRVEIDDPIVSPATTAAAGLRYLT